MVGGDQPGWSTTMIMICERCYGRIGDGEAVVRLAHIAEALPDGSMTWWYSYTHPAAAATCGATVPPGGGGPDTGEWNPARGIGGGRA
jgi:hypothetical protein